MHETSGNPPLTAGRRLFPRRRVLQTIAAAAGAGVAARLVPGAAFAQGRCMLTPGTASCNTSDIPPVFEPTGWKTVALDHVAFRVADHQKEAAFYAALMGWTPRAETATETILDIGDWGSARFRQEPGTTRAVVQSFAFVIDPWNAKTVEMELRRRGLDPVADDDGKGFESFHVLDPDGFDLQLCNGGGLAKARRTPSAATLVGAAAVRVHRMEDGLARPLLVFGDELQGHRVVLHEPARLEADVRRGQSERVPDGRRRRHHHPRRQSAGSGVRTRWPRVFDSAQGRRRSGDRPARPR